MKKIVSLIVLVFVFALYGCFDSVDEMTVNENGSGVFVNTSDLSSLVSMVKTFAGDKLKEAEDKNIDTTINLNSLKDSLGNLTSEEKKLLEKATLRAIMSIKDEKIAFTFSFPYSIPSDIAVVGTVLKKTKNKALSKLLAGANPEGKNTSTWDMVGLDKEENSYEVGDYYTYKVEKGRLSKKLNKEMYEKVGEETSMTKLREMSSMGFNSKMKTVIHLPKPAKKAEGKNVELSADKKTVTIEAKLDDFFEDGSVLEYEIEY